MRRARVGFARVAYADLVTAPASVVRDTHDRSGVEAPADLDARVAGYVAAQAAGKRAAPPSDIATYGLSHDAFLDRPKIAEY